MAYYICDNCGVGFNRKTALCERKFCTRKCSGQYRSKTYVGSKSSRWAGGKVESTCKQCGKKFLQDPHQVGVRLHCSRECVNQFKKTAFVGKRSNFWKGGKIKRVCEICSKEFFVYPSVIKRKPARFCSKLCQNEWQKTLTGELANQWKGGTWHKGYPTAFNRRIRMNIRERDNYTCQGCGITEDKIVEKFGRKLSIHHIDHKRDNLSYTNLITVCYKCNNQANANHGHWEKFYRDILVSRGII